MLFFKLSSPLHVQMLKNVLMHHEIGYKPVRCSLKINLMMSRLQMAGCIEI